MGFECEGLFLGEQRSVTRKKTAARENKHSADDTQCYY